LKLVVLAILSAFYAGGCLFDSGTSTFPQGKVNAATICSSPASASCPACSSPDGAFCRGDWYTNALRCTSDAQCGASNACQQGFCVLKDADGDGIDDDFERELAETNFPAVYLATGESCGSPHGVIYHVRRHPLIPSRFAITYIVLYTLDCGQLNGHIGDAESFAITVDPNAQPGAPATVAVETWAHAGTTCGSTSSCDAAMGTSACGDQSTSPADIVVYASANKHAHYLSQETCANNCLDSCNQGERITGPFLNVGEPDHPMVTDLTTQGFVQADTGWNLQLLHINPWSTTEFGGGGRLDKPLTDNLSPPGQ
jgi:hypothetical protein